MTIGPVAGTLGLPPTALRPESPGPAEGAAASQSSPGGRGALHPKPTTDTLARAHDGSRAGPAKTVPAHRRLELRLHKLDRSSDVVMRFVNPETGEVVREFPPERLAQELADLRARAASHLDEKA